jgi:hypothetical protein
VVDKGPLQEPTFFRKDLGLEPSLAGERPQRVQVLPHRGDHELVGRHVGGVADMDAQHARARAEIGDGSIPKEPGELVLHSRLHLPSEHPDDHRDDLAASYANIRSGSSRT